MEQIISNAVRAVRKASGDTQQQFAQRLGLAISSVVRYEHGAIPELPILVKLALLADECACMPARDVLCEFAEYKLGIAIDWGRPTADRIAGRDSLALHSDSAARVV
jgi:transcriptional regulator with XRE-family HTH domain